MSDELQHSICELCCIPVQWQCSSCRRRRPTTGRWGSTRSSLRSSKRPLSPQLLQSCLRLALQYRGCKSSVRVLLRGSVQASAAFIDLADHPACVLLHIRGLLTRQSVTDGSIQEL